MKRLETDRISAMRAAMQVRQLVEGLGKYAQYIY
jgi:hypothetical protein